jgi:hypothetical protein
MKTPAAPEATEAPPKPKPKAKTPAPPAKRTKSKSTAAQKAAATAARTLAWAAKQKKRNVELHHCARSFKKLVHAMTCFGEALEQCAEAFA